MMEKIHPLIWKGQCIPDRESRMTFARQDVPTSFQCGLWRCLLRQLLHPAANVSALRLHQSLGWWTAELPCDGAPWTGTPPFIGAFFHLLAAIWMPVDTFRYITLEWTKSIMIQNRTGTPPQYQHKPLLPISPVSTRFMSPVPLARSHLSDRQQLHFRSGFNSFRQQREDLLPITPLRNAMLLNRNSYSIYKSHVLSLWVLMSVKNIMIGNFRGFCAPQAKSSLSWTPTLLMGHRCHSALRSEVAAIASLTLYLDKLAAYREILVCCQFRLRQQYCRLYQCQTLRDLIPKRRFPIMRTFCHTWARHTTSSRSLFSLTSTATRIWTQNLKTFLSPSSSMCFVIVWPLQG
jgi:hypothetical protein